jgi:RecB family exonuclease
VVVLSKSSLSTFITCPRLFKFLYVDKVQQDRSSPEAQRGIAFHEFACSFYDNLYISGDQFQIDQQWLQEQIQLMTPDTVPFVKNFVEFEQNRWKLCVEEKPDNPAKFFLPVLKEKKILNLGLEMVGIIDRVDLNFDEKGYTICDYKTERFSTKSWKMTEHRREATFYKILLENSGLIDLPVTSFAFIYPRSNDVWAEDFGTRTLSAFKKKITQVRQEIEAEEFPCKVGIFCRFCNCNNICDMS